MGRDGAMVVTRNSRFAVPAVPVVVVDTVGAGDTFTAALCRAAGELSINTKQAYNPMPPNNTNPSPPAGIGDPYVIVDDANYAWERYPSDLDRFSFVYRKRDGSPGEYLTAADGQPETARQDRRR